MCHGCLICKKQQTGHLLFLLEILCRPNFILQPMQQYKKTEAKKTSKHINKQNWKTE